MKLSVHLPAGHSPSFRLKMILFAYRIGANAAHDGDPKDPEQYGAGPGSEWADWYSEGYDGQPLREELTQRGVTA